MPVFRAFDLVGNLTLRNLRNGENIVITVKIIDKHRAPLL